MLMKLAKLDLKNVFHGALEFLPGDDTVLVFVDFFHNIEPHLIFFVKILIIPVIAAKFAPQLISSDLSISVNI